MSDLTITPSSLWALQRYGSVDFLQPLTTPYGLVIGQNLHSSVVTGFSGVSAVFNGAISGANDGINYFVNLGYGNSFVALGGVFVGGHAQGTSSAPTQTTADNYLAGLSGAAYDGSAWTLSGAVHVISGIYISAASAAASAVVEKDIWIGGLQTRMIGWESDTNAIKFNEAQLDSDITFYYDLGTTLVMDGGTGNITAGNLSATTANSLANIDTAQTLTNKRVTPRVGTTSSSGTPTINTDTTDIYVITAQSAAITSFTTNLSGTPTNGQKLWIAITDDGTARAITWGSSFESSGNVTLPTTTVISTRLDIGFVWNAATSKWRCVGVS